MDKSPDIGSDEFEKLLLWLDRDREAAGRAYEQIRLRLIKIFQARGCHIAEELADETIERVTKKAASLLESYEGEPILYFYAVARNVYREFTRRPKTVELPAHLPIPPESAAPDETDYECLSRCLARLDAGQRDLIVNYYPPEKQAKIGGRQSLAARLAVSPETLRTRAYRTRLKLQSCVRACVAAKSGGQAARSSPNAK